MAYLNAAILELLLSIAGDDDDAKKPMAHLLQLFSLVFWTYILTDAFDTADVAAARLPPQDCQGRGGEAHPAAEAGWPPRLRLAGSLSRDAALWFNLLGIGLAFAGVVTHRDVCTRGRSSSSGRSCTTSLLAQPAGAGYATS